MRALMPRISLIAEPARFGDDRLRQEHAASQMANAERMAEDLRQQGLSDVETKLAFLRDCVPSGLILLSPSASIQMILDECAAVAPSPQRLAQRIVVLGIDRADVFETLEHHHLAAAVETYRYFLWTGQTPKDSGEGLHGLRTVAEKMGADRIQTNSETDQRYCLLGSSHLNSLPALLADYLRGYNEIYHDSL